MKRDPEQSEMRDLQQSEKRGLQRGEKHGLKSSLERDRVRVFESASDEETRAIGAEIAAEIAALAAPPRLLILTGDLGAGKTTLVKGIVAALAAEDEDAVTSPTFTLVHAYQGWSQDRPVTVLHLDLYRLEDERQLATLGLAEMANDALVLVEWGERFRSVRELADGSIRIETTGPQSRRITLAMKTA